MNKYRFECYTKSGGMTPKWLESPTYARALHLVYTDPDVISTKLVWIDLPDGTQVFPTTPGDYDNWDQKRPKLDQTLFGSVRNGQWFTIDPFHPYETQYVKIADSLAYNIGERRNVPFDPGVLTWTITTV